MLQAIVPVSDEIELCVEVGGNPDNPPLLMIMGLGSQLFFWPEALLKRLIDAGFYVIRFDNRDIGLSSKIKPHTLKRQTVYSSMAKLQLGLDASKTPAAYRLPDMAKDAANLIQALGLRQTHVIGASMGGMIAQILAAQYPHLVDRLALIFSTNNRPFLSPPKPPQLKTLLKKPPSIQKDAIVEHGKWFIKQVGSPGHINEEDVGYVSALRYDRNYYPAGTSHQFYAILLTGTIHSYSKSIAAPTLIMHGSEDGLLPITHGRAVAKDIPNAKFVPIKGMAHDLPPYFHSFIAYQLSQHMLKK